MVVNAFCNSQPNVLVNKAHDDMVKGNMHISVLFHSSIILSTMTDSLQQTFSPMLQLQLHLHVISLVARALVI